MPSHTFILDPGKKEELLEGLKDEGFEITKPPHTHFLAKKQGVSCTLYTSGKLLVQGKEMAPFIEFFLEPKILGTFEYTNPHAHVDMTPRIGVDEAGKGDFFGPLCVASLYADEEQIKELLALGVKDSKTMNDTKIKELARGIKKICQSHTVMINPEKYNEIYPKFRNLNSLLAWGHATAIEQLVAKTGCKDVIIDQFANESVVENAVSRKELKLNLIQRTKGESDVVVAAASIIARDSFLFGLEKLSQMINSSLPKGASAQVVAAGRKLFQRVGEAGLARVAKRHFKTWNQVCSTED